MNMFRYHAPPLSLQTLCSIYSLFLVAYLILSGVLVVDLSHSNASTFSTLTYDSYTISPTPQFVSRYCAQGSLSTTGLSPRSGTRALRFQGTDDCPSNNSYVWYKLTDTDYLITDNTILRYKIAPRNTFGQNVAIDLQTVNTVGQVTYLSKQQMYSKDGILANPQSQKNHASFNGCCPLGQLITIEVALGRLRGQRIKQVLIGYDDNYNEQSGSFDARVDDVQILEVNQNRKYPLGSIIGLVTPTYVRQNMHTSTLVSSVKTSAGAFGTVIDGPYVIPGGTGYPSQTYWNVDFDKSLNDGWVEEKYLTQSFTDNNQISTATVKSADTCPTILKGDTDCSGAVTVTDAVVILNCASGLGLCNSSPPDLDILLKEDMDCNGAVSITDGVLALRKSAELAVPECSTVPVDLSLTCGTGHNTALPVTDAWSISGSNVSARVGVNRNFGGIGVELTLSGTSQISNGINVVESRSGAGAGWQTSYWGLDVPTNHIYVMNQASGNSTNSQWGFHNGFANMAQTLWNVLPSDHYSPDGTFGDTSIGTSPCNNNATSFDYGKLAFELGRRSTSVGTAVSIKNQYALHAKIAQNFSRWGLEQALYLNSKVARDNNLRAYFVGKNGWKEGPISLWKDFSISHGSGSCESNKCDYGITDVAYAVLVWNINGVDVGVAIPSTKGMIVSMGKTEYCTNSADITCGNIAIHNYLDLKESGFHANVGAERIYGVDYSVGTPAELRALGYQY